EVEYLVVLHLAFADVFVKDDTAGDVFINFFQRTSAGLRDHREDEDERDDSDACEEEESTSQADEFHQGWDEQAAECVGNTEEEYRDTNCCTTHGQWEELREHDPRCNVQEGLHGAYKDDDQGEDDVGAEWVADWEREGRNSDENVGDCGQCVAGNEGGAAVDAVHHP